ncbi:efflux RND transporter periplasmic adaptor subunit [Actinomadura macrotermitis]|uniref:Membrane fusion protein, macrolide-specific efflux system n=1 Tax=Actinomadura macrotermitis TaxID=2585200 RepID=A0A7K0BY30_9ACTN|nr:HlyD family efflux transporter periplasmic adaptor subunit [Actinomadura macrotermitis]MQY06079.1 hypothetical protein [Actinomadura macrotermitis]
MKRPFPRRALLINGTLGVLLAGGVGVAYLSLTDDDAGAAAGSRLTPVSRGTVTASVSASGSVESARSSALSFGTSGTVAKIYVKAGQRVGKGDLLARLDQTAALEALSAAKANLDATTDTGTAKGYAGYLQVKNAYSAAQRTYAGTLLRAPFSGTVTAVNGTVGGPSSGTASSPSASSDNNNSSGTSSTGFMELADTGHLLVKGDFTEADTTKLKTGQTATVSFDALPGTTATGRITAIGAAPTTTDNVVKYPATVALTKVPAGIRLGQTATVEVVTSSAENVLYVPAAAVRTAGGRSTVTVERAGRRGTVQVEVGIKGDQGTEIRSGLDEGDKVVVTVTTQSGPNNRFPAGRTGGGFPGGGMRGGRP